MIYTELTNRAMRIAYEAHHGQEDVNGVPYIFHPFHVAEQMEDEITACVALLHDIVEDTDVTIEELQKIFPSEVTGAVALLTRNRDEDYFDYVRKIKDNSVAKAVKLGDLAHNMDESRLCGGRVSREQIEKWRRKYTRAKEILTDGGQIS